MLFMHTLLLYHWYFLPWLFKPHPEIGAAFAGLKGATGVLLQSKRGGLSVVSVAGVSDPTSLIVFSSSSRLMSARTCATTGFVCSSRTRRSSEGRREPIMAEPKCCWIRYRVCGSWNGGIHSIPTHPMHRSSGLSSH